MIKKNAIRRKLLRMCIQDQRLRKTPSSNHDEQFWKKWEEVHRNNEAVLKQIIGSIGWPTVSKVGTWASRAAWLIVQHADKDVAFQKKCIQLMSEEQTDDVLETDIAYLYDRICVNEGRPQFFGTQFTTNTYGAYGPQPIFDPLFVDARRRAIGLESLVEYKRRLERKYAM